MKTYFVDDELLPEYLEWQGPGYYCSQQRGSHENQHIVTVRCGDADSNLDEMSAYNYRNGWGTAGWLDKPYGHQQRECKWVIEEVGRDNTGLVVHNLLCDDEIVVSGLLYSKVRQVLKGLIRTGDTMQEYYTSSGNWTYVLTCSEFLNSLDEEMEKR